MTILNNNLNIILVTFLVIVTTSDQNHLKGEGFALLSLQGAVPAVREGSVLFVAVGACGGACSHLDRLRIRENQT